MSILSTSKAYLSKKAGLLKPLYDTKMFNPIKIRLVIPVVLMFVQWFRW